MPSLKGDWLTERRKIIPFLLGGAGQSPVAQQLPRSRAYIRLPTLEIQLQIWGWKEERPSEPWRWDTQVCLEWSLKSGTQNASVFTSQRSRALLWFWSSFRNEILSWARNKERKYSKPHTVFIWFYQKLQIQFSITNEPHVESICTGETDGV